MFSIARIRFKFGGISSILQESQCWESPINRFGHSGQSAAEYLLAAALIGGVAVAGLLMTGDAFFHLLSRMSQNVNHTVASVNPTMATSNGGTGGNSGKTSSSSQSKNNDQKLVDVANSQYIITHTDAKTGVKTVHIKEAGADHIVQTTGSDGVQRVHSNELTLLAENWRDAQGKPLPNHLRERIHLLAQKAEAIAQAQEYFLQTNHPSILKAIHSEDANTPAQQIQLSSREINRLRRIMAIARGDTTTSQRNKNLIVMEQIRRVLVAQGYPQTLSVYSPEVKKYFDALNRLSQTDTRLQKAHDQFLAAYATLDRDLTDYQKWRQIAATRSANERMPRLQKAAFNQLRQRIDQHAGVISYVNTTNFLTNLGYKAKTVGKKANVSVAIGESAQVTRENAQQIRNTAKESKNSKP